MKYAQSIVPMLGPELGASIMVEKYGATLCIYAWRRMILLSLFWSDK